MRSPTKISFEKGSNSFRSSDCKSSENLVENSGAKDRFFDESSSGSEKKILIEKIETIFGAPDNSFPTIKEIAPTSSSAKFSPV